MTKKILAMFLAVMMVISLLPTSVLAQSEKPHCGGAGNHCVSIDATENKEWNLENLPTVDSSNYQVLGVFEATCKEDGGLKARCNVCGETFYMVITEKANAKEDGQHNWINVAAVEATCEEPGLRAYSYCDVCGAVKYVDAKAKEQFKHDGVAYNKDTKKWELTEATKTLLTTTSDEKNGHKWENTSEFDCTTGGKFTVTCTICKKTKEVELNNNGQHHIAKGEYALGDKVVQCDTCYKYVDVVEDKLHDCNDAWVIVGAKAPTCTETGVKAHRYCAACGKYELLTATGYAGKNEDDVAYTKEDTIIEAEGHDYTENAGELNCKSTYLRCDKCELGADEETFKQYMSELYLKGHDFGDAVWTCKTDEKHACTICEVEFTADEVEAEREEHDYDDEDGYKSCTDKTRKCTVCKKNIKQDEELLGVHEWEGEPCLEAEAVCTICEKTALELGFYTTGEHKYGDWVIIRPADCENAAEGVKVCAVCGYEYEGVPQAALKHDLKTDNVIPGTCTTKKITYTYCTRPNCPNAKLLENDKGNQATISIVRNGATEYLYAYYVAEWDDFENEYVSGWEVMFQSSEYAIAGDVLLVFNMVETENGFNLVWNDMTLNWNNAHFSLNEGSPIDFSVNKAGLLCKDGMPINMKAQSGTLGNAETVPEGRLTMKLTTGFCYTGMTEGNVDPSNHGDHAREEVVTTEATCLTDKWTKWICSGCKVDLTEPEKQENTSLKHKYTSEITKVPNCQKDGEITYTCDRTGCGHSYTETLTLAEYQKTNKDYTGHNWGDMKTASHNEQVVSWEATCGNEGCTEKKTFTVKWEYADVEIFESIAKATEAAGAGHEVTEGTDETITAASCESTGVNRFKCEICQNYVSYKTSALGHSFTKNATDGGLKDQLITNESYLITPTCKKVGYEYSWKCEREGCTAEHIVYDENGEEVEYIELPIVYHEYEETKAFKDAKAAGKLSVDTCKDLIWKTCKYGCGAQVKAFEHVDTVNGENKDLCSKYTYELYLTYEGKLLVHNKTGNFEHLWFNNSEKDHKDASCSTVGYHTESCYWCAKDKIVEDAKIPHRNERGELFADSCQDTETDRHCELCGKDIAQSHNWELKFHEATCEAPAYYQFVCCMNGCEEAQEPVYIGTATGHKAPDDFEMPEANYDGDQKWSYVCETCGKTVSGTVEMLTGAHMVLDAEDYTFGSLVTVTVRLDNVYDVINAYQFRVKFNDSALTYVGYKDLTNGEFISSASDVDETYYCKLDFVNVSGVYGGTGNYEINGSLELVELYFRVSTDYTSESAIDLIRFDFDMDFDEENGERVNYYFYPAVAFWAENEKARDFDEEVDITANMDHLQANLHQLGDYNGLAGLTIHDVREALALITEEGYNVAVDVNYDGKFDAEDVRLLLALVNSADKYEASMELVKANMTAEELDRYFGYASCPNEDCGWYGDSDYTYCPDCGTELDHFIR